MRVPGKRGSVPVQPSPSLRYRTQSSKICRASPPTGKNQVEKVLENFVLTSRASWSSCPWLRLTCFSFREVRAPSRTPVKSTQAISALPTGFIYRYGTLSSDGHRIRTEVLSSDEGSGIARQESRHEWLYSQREVTELFYRLGFSAITYDEEAEVGRTKNCISSVPSHVAHCRVNIGRTPQRMLP